MNFDIGKILKTFTKLVESILGKYGWYILGGVALLIIFLLF